MKIRTFSQRGMSKNGNEKSGNEKTDAERPDQADIATMPHYSASTKAEAAGRDQVSRLLRYL